MSMSTEPDVEKLAEALRTDPEARDAVVAAIVDEMNVDPDTAEGQATQSYRRDVLKALGVLGTGAAIGGGAHQAMTRPAAASHGGGSVGTSSDRVDVYANSLDAEALNGAPIVRDGDSIADAITAAPSGGETILVAEDYDPSVETLPVTVDKPVEIIGPGAFSEAQLFDASLAGTGDVFFEVNQSTSRGTQSGATFRNFGLLNAGYSIKQGVATRWENCVVYQGSHHGWVWANDTNSKFDNVLVNCHAAECATDGFQPNGGAHALALVGCSSRLNGNAAVRNFGGVGVTILGGNYEKSGGNGTDVDLRDKANYVIGAYLEADSNTTPNQLVNLGGQGSGVAYCYINGSGSAGSGVRFDASDTSAYQCVFNNVVNQAMNIASGSDVDINHASHAYPSTGTVLNSGGTRPRSNGVIGGGPIGGVDLSLTSGRHEGDEAMSSGATANTGDTAYSSWRWDSTNAVWTDESGNTV